MSAPCRSDLETRIAVLEAHLQEETAYRERLRAGLHAICTRVERDLAWLPAESTEAACRRFIVETGLNLLRELPVAAAITVVVQPTTEVR